MLFWALDQISVVAFGLYVPVSWIMPWTASQSCLSTASKQIKNLKWSGHDKSIKHLHHTLSVLSKARNYWYKAKGLLTNSSSSLCNTSTTPTSLMLRQNIISSKEYLSKVLRPKANQILQWKGTSGLKTEKSNHSARRFHDPISEQGPQLLPESSQGSE